jgi:hypothetical protein
MKRKSIYLFLMICCISMISSARQRYYSSCTETTVDGVAKAKAAGQKESCGKETGYDLSPVGFFVLNM